MAVLAFRGTRATHRGNLAADIGILRHNTRRAELRIAEEARAVVEGFTAQLEVGTPGVKYVWVATGHSLGGFLATTVTICFPHIHRCVTFESPGCPKFYRDMAAKRAGEYDNYWKVGPLAPHGTANRKRHNVSVQVNMHAGKPLFSRMAGGG